MPEPPDDRATDDALSGLLLSLQGAFPRQRSNLLDAGDEIAGWPSEVVGNARTLTNALANRLRKRETPVV